NAQTVSLGWRITEGEHENRIVWQSIVIQHSDSPDAQKFGRHRFKDVCAACGITEAVTDLSVLMYKPCSISITIEQDKTGQYPDKNKVGRVMPVVASWNGPKPNTATVLRDASTVASSGKPEQTELNDKIPF